MLGLRDFPCFGVCWRRAIDGLGEVIEDHPLDGPADALLTMKRREAALSVLWEDESYSCIELQRRLSRSSEFDSARARLRDLVSDADRGMKLLRRMEARLYELREHHEHTLQEQTNRRRNVLAILSSIYMPATWIAGIHGMNFENIPIIRAPYGYRIVVSMMLVVVVGQAWYFSRSGWFE